ncbi:MAG TPA: phenylalanine--tRNA ligase subunit alpha [Chlamydiales bacterium]|nr:phenylalanine--tRNA ligase subunit alpha [Chlamydiales bacterium]
MSFQENIQSIQEAFEEDLSKATTSKQLEDLKVQYLGKKGSVSSLMRFMKDLSPSEKPVFGQSVNDLKQLITTSIEDQAKTIYNEELNAKFEKEAIDVTLPGKQEKTGGYHPVSQMLHRILDVMQTMGFSVATGPDLDSDYYNFEGLNFDKDHPARDMQDTFFITEDLLLRTHTSNVQVRVMEKSEPPLRVAVPGKCFRNENISARSHVFFHQVEAFCVDTNITFADLLSTMDEFWKRLLGTSVETRYRPSYFPFVEPGLEGDIKCIICNGQGCRICKHTGWLEVIGAGMIHPNVLKAGGIDPEKYSGFAWGLGVERLAMLLHNIKDIRLFTENDDRFLKQFR